MVPPTRRLPSNFPLRKLPSRAECPAPAAPWPPPWNRHHLLPALRKGGSMNQQPFEDWLFSDEPLSAAEEKEMQIFLESNPREARLEAAGRSLRPALTSPEMVAPEAGFSQRWLHRWA